MNTEARFISVEKDVVAVNERVDGCEEKIACKTDKLEFEPIKKIVWGVVMIILSAVITALISLVLRQK